MGAVFAFCAGVDMHSAVVRAVAAERSGDYQEAVTLYSAVLSAHPENVESREGRGRSYFALTEFGLAAGDFAYILRQQPADEYSKIWLFLSKRRKGDFASKKLDTELMGYEGVAWPEPIVEYLAGRSDWETMFDTAMALPGTDRKRAICESAFFYAENEMVLGEAVIAMGEFGFVKASRCAVTPPLRALAQYQYDTLYQAGFRPKPSA